MATKGRLGSTTGPKKSTQHDGQVSIEVDPVGPYGMHLEAGPGGVAAAITFWERLPTGKFGAIQRHGGVRIGDLVVRVNDLDCALLAFNQVVGAVQNSNVVRKAITFASPAQHREMARRRHGAGGGVAVATGSSGGAGVGGVSSGSMGGAGRAEQFISSVRQARINKDNAREPFAEYEVVCKLTLATSKVERDSTLRWSMWHRYSAFERLDKDLRGSLGWLMQKVKFPPKYNLTFNKLKIAFVEKRREALDEYYQKVHKYNTSPSIHSSSSIRPSDTMERRKITEGEAAHCTIETVPVATLLPFPVHHSCLGISIHLVLAMSMDQP